MKILICPIAYIDKNLSPVSRVKQLAQDLLQEGFEVGIAGNIAYDLREAKFFKTPAYRIPTANKVFADINTDNNFEQFLYNYKISTYNELVKQTDFLLRVIKQYKPDILFSFDSLPCMIAAQIRRLPIYTTYHGILERKKSKKYIKDLNKTLKHYDLEAVESMDELYRKSVRLFVQSNYRLDPIKFIEPVDYIGGLRLPDVQSREEKKTIVVSLNPEIISIRKQKSIMKKCFYDPSYKVVIQANTEDTSNENVILTPMPSLDIHLKNACLYIHSGYENQCLDGISYGLPQIIVPDTHCFARFNARNMRKNLLAIELDDKRFDVKHIYEAYKKLTDRSKYEQARIEFKEEMNQLDGNQTIINTIKANLLECK